MAMGLSLLVSAGSGAYLLATDRSLWLLAVSHAVGLIMIVVIDTALGLLSISSPKKGYLPSIAAALLGLVLQLGDIFTAPQYNMSISHFASYLFGLWAFDVLLALQIVVIGLGVAGRPYAQYLARRKSRRGQELNYSRRSFVKAVAAVAGLVGIGVVVGSVKLPAPASPTSQTSTTTQSGATKGAVANANSIQIGQPVYFDYPTGYPNILMKNADGTLTALSLLCTHVCCLCSYDGTSKAIFCPCHGSVFDLSGRVVVGPAFDPLPKIQLNVDSAGTVFPVGVSNPGPCHA
jgi:cytochrome b6-f complex iron-sulfur subunit